MKKINISPVDTIFANGSYPIEFLLYFKEPIDTQPLRDALKTLSSVFWPLFGEYADGIIFFDQYGEKDCLDAEIFDKDFDPEETSENIYRQFGHVNPVEMPKLFFLKILQYRNGTVLVPKMNHLAGDGYSYFYFLSALASLCQGNKLTDTPFNQLHHHRTVLKKFQLPLIELAPPRKPAELIIRFEAVPKRSIRNLIKSVAAEFDERVSGNDLLSAMILQKSVSLQPNYPNDDFYLTIPIDIRSQVKEYGMNFFGNGLMFSETKFTVTKIQNSLVAEIAIKIRKSMPEITTGNYLNYLESLERLIENKQVQQLKPYNPENGCLVTNLSLLPTHKLDFGNGNPDFIFTLTVGKNSTAILADKENYVLRLVY